MSNPLLTSVSSLVTRTGMLPPGSTVVVAVSGGQDSCALLHALASLSSELRLHLHVAHLDHGFRGRESAEDAEFVRAFSQALAVPASIEHQDVPGMARRLHLSKQEAARGARHRFLERVAQETGADRIALGHTQDDRVETILLNVLRGTGPDGLRGLAPISGKRVRPLLDVSREETGRYCEHNGIAYRMDASNLSLAYKRNRLREELLPHLESYYNPEVRGALLRLSDLAAEESTALDEHVRALFTQILLNTEPHRVVLSADGLAAAPMALRRRIMRVAIEKVRGSLENIDFAWLERLNTALEQTGEQRGFQFTLPPGNIYVCVEPGRFTVERRAGAGSARPIAYSLTVPGEVAVPELGARISVHIEAADRSKLGIAGVCLDADKVRPPLAVRTPKPGDRMQPLGMKGTRKLQDIFTDRKVPAAERPKTLLVEDAEGLLWVAGYTISERGRITEATKNVLIINMYDGAQD